MIANFTHILFVLYAILFISVSDAQVLNPGFDKKEYEELLYVSTRTAADSVYAAKYRDPEGFKMVYQSPTMGLDNLWDLWIDDRNVAVISIRGTTGEAKSWLANFYAAMIPAKGTLKLSESEVFQYALADDPRATVHVGWLLSTAYLSKDILPKIDACYEQGVRDILIMGHSQGGAISFLLTAHLRSLQKQGRIPADIQFKTYCSAGPKPGNLYFAYEYEAMTQNGWAYNVVNAADWVPETPISIQTASDFNRTNPFADVKTVIKKQKFPQNVALRHVYNKLDKPTRKAQKNYEKYLGKMVSNMITTNLPEFIPPAYSANNHYVRTGVTIVLTPDAEYYTLFPDSKTEIFVHHFHAPYLYLLEKLEM